MTTAHTKPTHSWVTLFKTVALAVSTYTLCTNTALGAPASTTAPDGKSTNSALELSPIKAKGFKTAWKSASATQQKFNSVYIAEPTLAFSKDWYRDHRFDLSKRDEARIKKQYTGLLHKSLTKQLSKKLNLEVSENPSPTSLVVKPELTHFRITAPDLSFSGRTKNYVDHVGSTRVHLEISSGDGPLLYRLEDYELTESYHGVMELKPTNRAENARDFRRLFERWGGQLARFIIEDQATSKR